MTTTATIQSRELVITVDGIEEPFSIAPLPGTKGQDLTNTFLGIAAGRLHPEGMEQVLITAVGEAVYARVKAELTLSEGESVLLPAFYWQTVLGLSGVNAYIDAGEGLAGSAQALRLLVATLGISPTRTGHLPTTEFPTASAEAAA